MNKAYILQWRIEDFPDGGPGAGGRQPPTYYLPKNCIKMKEFIPRGGCP